MSIEAIKKALKKVYIGEWYISGVKTNGLSVVHNAADSSMFGITAETFEAEYICAANPFAVTDLISEIDRLQRENASLREDRYKFAYAITGGEDAPGLLDSTPTSEIVEIAQHAHRMHQGDIDRAMAAEAEVARLQTELALSKPLYSRRQIEARVKLLEAALKPFAKMAGTLPATFGPDHEPIHDDEPVHVRCCGFDLGEITVADLNRTALSAQVQDVAVPEAKPEKKVEPDRSKFPYVWEGPKPDEAIIHQVINAYMGAQEREYDIDQFRYYKANWHWHYTINQHMKAAVDAASPASKHGDAE